jgi:hypothetical protein
MIPQASSPPHNYPPVIFSLERAIRSLVLATHADVRELRNLGALPHSHLETFTWLERDSQCPSLPEPLRVAQCLNDNKDDLR